jgi:HlyD family secretion protein
MNFQALPDQTEITEALGLDRSGRRRRWALRMGWIALVAGLLALGAWWYVAKSDGAGEVSHKTEAATRADLTIRVLATGKIQPTNQVDVSSEMSGVIRRVHVDDNSIVRKGDVLAELDAVKLEAMLARAHAALLAARARVLTAEATIAETRIALDRARTLRKKGISSGQELDAAKAAFDRANAAHAAATADVKVAEADVALQEADLDKTRILSPIDGVVLRRSAEPGQTVASSLQAPVLFTLAEDLARMQVEADVDEADIGVVSAGQKASFSVDAYPGRNFPAEIATVEYSPKVTDNVVTYTAVLAVDNAALLLRPGMTATAQVTVREIAGALLVPNAALRYEPPKPKAEQGFSLTRLFLPRFPRFQPSSNKTTALGEATLYVLVGGAPKPVAVRIGGSDGQMTEILSGELKEGDAVIVAGGRAGP